MIFGMTSANAWGDIPQMPGGCIVNISQASEFTQEDELKSLHKQSGQLPIGQSFTHRQERMEGRCPGLQGAAVLWHAVPAAGNRRALMKSRGNYSCQALWSQGHVLHLQGHHGIIWGVACTHSAAEKEIFFSPTTSDTCFARGRAWDQLPWWAGLVFLGHNSMKPRSPFWLFQNCQQNLFITECEQQSHKATRLLLPAMPKGTSQRKKNLK